MNDDMDIEVRTIAGTEMAPPVLAESSTVAPDDDQATDAEGAAADDDLRVTAIDDDAEPPPAKLSKAETRKQKIHEQINASVRERGEAERARDAAVQARDEALRALEDTRRVEVRPVAQVAARVDGAAKPVVSDYEDYETFVEALSEWKFAQLSHQRAESEAQQRATVAAEVRRGAHLARMRSAEAADPTFADVMKRADSIPSSPAISHVIMDSPIGPKLIKHLIEHPEEVHTLFQASDRSRFASLAEAEQHEDLARYRAMVLLEARLSAAHSGSAPAPVQARSAASPPIKPVVALPVADDPLAITPDLSTDEHIRRMNLRERRGLR